MSLMDVAGIHVGHWTDDAAMTGVTVIVAPRGTVGSGEVRGLAPATRETALLDPAMTVDHVDAVVLAGGSAFGLGCVQGVMEELASQGRGYETRAGPVPIVAAACVFDLGVGTATWPMADDAKYAMTALNGRETGQVGAGTGCTVGKRAGPEWMSRGGLGQASFHIDGVSAEHRAASVTVAALAVVNTVGDVLDADGSVLAGCRQPPGDTTYEPGFRDNTALLVIATSAALAKVECFLLAARAQDSLAATVRPAHTRYDDDVAFSLATGSQVVDRPAAVDRILEAGAAVAVDAIRDAVRGPRRGVR